MSTKKSNPFIEIDNSKPDLRKKEEPLISLRVTNPITYIKSWWKKVMSKEGVDFSFKIKPLTAIAITIVIATFGFGVGKFSFTSQKPFIKYVPVVQPTPKPTPDLWRKTAFTGTLRFASKENQYYLLTNSSEAINLMVLENVNLEELISRRIFATGEYNTSTNTLVVSEAMDMEVLPKTAEKIPVSTTATPTPKPVVVPTIEPTPSASPQASDSSDAK